MNIKIIENKKINKNEVELKMKEIKEKFYNTDYNEQETIIIINYAKSEVEIYTCRKITYLKLKAKLGKPTKTYFINKSVCGASWKISFSDKKKITSVFSRPLLIGSVK